MKIIICCLLNFTILFCAAQNNFNIVPAPTSIKFIDTSYTYDLPIQIVHNRSEAAVFNALYLLEALKQRNITGQLVAFDSLDLNRSKIMLIDEDEPTENYRIITPGKEIIISGNNRTIFYGIQTLLQLIPTDQYYSTKNKISIPYVSIADQPRFLYRGMHLDVCRHFFPVSFIKKYIDHLAAYKFNTFHWHLTDDQGWRIEIKKYPGLTTTGALRNGTIIGRYPGKGSDNKPYGGFYTQEEIKEVVNYAAKRYIDVIPEIEMPGHGSAAIAAYPWLSCFPKKTTEIPAKMISQKSIDEQKKGRIKLVQETWGVFDDIFCAGRDSTFTFLENVIDEVTALFPSKYFHMGGDEAPKAHWKKCPYCQLRMKNEKLKDEHELQSYFVQRIEKYVNSKGKILIGWDEILEGGLAPNAVVMSWRGEKGGIEAAKQKHQVIMTPGNPVYFDHTQSKNEDSVTIGGYNPIENVYAYEPIPKELSAEEGKYILGAQANMWTEYIKYPSKVEYHLFPRITALSEVLWSPREKRNWKDFEKRLPAIFERLDKQKINYSKAYYDLKATVLPTENYNGVLWQLESKTNNPVIINFNNGDSIWSYTKPLLIKEGIFLANAVSKGITLSQKFYHHKATGKKITLAAEASKNYPGDGAFTLVNGVQNENGMSKTSEFLGFNGTDMEATIDLGKDTEVSKITLHSLNHPGSWIYLPSQVDISFIPFIDTTVITKHPPVETVTHIVKDENNDQTIQLPSPKSCRYIRVYAKNYGIIPDGKPGAGNRAWLFVDEIEVR